MIPREVATTRNWRYRNPRTNHGSFVPEHWTSEADFLLLAEELGWLESWTGVEPVDTGITLDQLIPPGNVFEQVRRSDEVMDGVERDRMVRIVARTIRMNTPLIQALKAAYQYRCQFPSCEEMIPTADGGYYAEVCHVKPFSEGGPTRLGNLLVLCPNHHKRLDWGKLELETQSPELLVGRLNGVPFEIRMLAFSPGGRHSC